MRKIKNVLVTVYISEESKEKLRKAFEPAEVVFFNAYDPRDKKHIAEAAKDADVCILNGDLDDDILAGEHVKWIHCCRAGVEKSARPEVFERGILLTSSSGKSAPALAEHALMFMLSLTYDLPMLFRAQKKHEWAVSREYFMKSGMYGKTVGIIGLGKTGCELARLCKGFGMKVLGYRRSTDVPENVDEVYSLANGDGIKPILEQSDYVVLCIELNDDTWKLIKASEFEVMKKTAYLVNMGRGGLIEESDMIAALEEGKIAGAGLDTFEVEPLQKTSPLWDMPNVIITPHITPQLPDKEERTLSYVFENIKAYKNESEMVNLVTKRNILTKE